MSDIDEITQLAVDDWTDQDLLTKAEARERLVEEIARTQTRLDQLTSGQLDDVAEIRLLTRRLDAMQAVRDEYTASPDGK